MPEAANNFRTIFKNFLSLNLVQLSNIIFPLIILPYVVRILGVEKFGMVSFVQAVIMYLVILSDYGFNLSGTREISLYRNDRDRISLIFSSILILKLAIGLVCFLFLCLIVLSVETLRSSYLLYFAGTGILLGSILFPPWFFQGIEKMEFIPLTNVIVRTLQVILTFLLVKTESDYLLYLVLISITQVLIGLCGLLISIIWFKVKIIIPSRDSLFHYLKSGFSLFTAGIGMSLFSNSSTFVLGILSGDYAVGIFSAADKIRQAVVSLTTGFPMSAYPAAVKVMKNMKESFSGFISGILRLSFALGSLASLILFLFADEIVMIMLGSDFKESAGMIRWFALTPVIAATGIIYRILILVVSGYDTSSAKIILLSLAVHLLLLFTLTSAFNSIGTVYAVIITELMISVLSVSVVKRKKLLPGFHLFRFGMKCL